MSDENTEGSTRQSENPISYEEIDFTGQDGFKPMIGVALLVLISFFLLAGLPQYATAGDGNLTLFSYTSVLWGIVIMALGFVYEFWLMRVEGGGW